MKYLQAFLNEPKFPPQERNPAAPQSGQRSERSGSLEVIPKPSPRNADLPAPPAKQQPPATIYQELADATPPSAALEVFPDWQGILVKSAVLGISVWVVRDHLHGLALARETGHPALMLDDILKRKGQTPEQARAELLELLITTKQ